MFNLQFETTTICGLSCVECPHRLMQRKQQIMSIEVFNEILRQYILPMGFDTVIPTKDGDCLFHPQIEYILSSIDNNVETKIDIYTNGLRLNPALVEFLGSLKNKIRLLISYHLYNADGSKNDYCSIDQEIIRCMDLKKHNVEFVMATHMTDMAKAEDLKAWQEVWIGVAKHYPKFEAVHVNKNINPWTGLIKQSNTVKFDICPYSNFEHLFIGVTGNVIPCCMDLEEKIIFGNIMTDDKEVIMDKVTWFYRQLAENKVDKELCRKCLEV